MKADAFRFLVVLFLAGFLLMGLFGVVMAGTDSDIVQDEVFSNEVDTETTQTTSYTVETIVYGIGLDEIEGSLYESQNLGNLNSKADAEVSEIGETGNSTAISEAYLIILESSDGNTFRKISADEISSHAIAKTPEGDALAEAVSYGIYLEGSDENTFKRVDFGSIDSKADAKVKSTGKATAEAESFGIYLDNSTGNTFRYIELSKLSSSAAVSSDEVATEKAATYGIFLGDAASGNTFLNSIIKGSDYGVRTAMPDTNLHFSAITKNEEYGAKNVSDGTPDLSLNWWGSEDGPVYYDKVDGEVEYNGGGDEVKGEAYIAPWIGANPDASEDEPGVQLTSPLPIIVRKVGPKPTTESGNEGYLNKAIWGGNYVDVRAKVIVDHGTYPLTDSIKDGTTLLSECGSSCKAIIEDDYSSKPDNGEVKIESEDVRIGKREDYSSRGFTIREDVHVAEGVDASTVDLNWNNLHGEIENDGDGRLDAEYNWWGDMDPSDDIKGRVDYHPFLPAEVCSFVDYMEKHRIEDPHAAVAGKAVENAGGEKRLISQLIAHFNVKQREAEDLFDEFGYGKVKKAYEDADGDYGSFLDNLGISSV